MKRTILSICVLIFFLFLGEGLAKEVKTTSRSGKSMTVVEPTESGGIHILQIEEETGKNSQKQKERDQTIEKLDSKSLSDQISSPSMERISEGQLQKKLREPQTISQRKARIVVIPAIYSQGARSRFERELYEKFDISDPSVIEETRFTGHIVDALVNSRKFDVLEREDLMSVVKEIDFGESDYADISKTARIGRMLNADYVVIPEIRYILLIKEAKDIPYIPKKNVKFEATLGTNIRVVDVRTTRLASSNIDETTYIEKQKQRKKEQFKQAVNFIDNFFSAVAAKEVSHIIDVVYPIKVIEVKGNLVTLNRGRGAIEPGEVLEVYAPGKILIDPDTKESLGYSESLMGKIEVTQVKSKVSIARLLEGEAKKYFICRRNREIKKIEENPVPKID